MWFSVVREIIKWKGSERAWKNQCTRYANGAKINAPNFHVWLDDFALNRANKLLITLY